MFEIRCTLAFARSIFVIDVRIFCWVNGQQPKPFCISYRIISYHTVWNISHTQAIAFVHHSKNRLKQSPHSFERPSVRVECSHTYTYTHTLTLFWQCYGHWFMVFGRRIHRQDIFVLNFTNSNTGFISLVALIQKWNVHFVQHHSCLCAYVGILQYSYHISFALRWWRRWWQWWWSQTLSSIQWNFSNCIDIQL